MLVDDDAEPKYPLYQFSKDILDTIQKRTESESISFKDLTKEQLAIKLNNDIAKIPNLLRMDQITSKEKLISVATDCYCFIAQIIHEEFLRKEGK